MTHVRTVLPPLWPLGLLLACLPWLAGCGGPTIKCTGQVLLDDKPLADAAVMFIPKDGSRVATGRTDSEGCFRLTTFNPGDGTFPGEHQVTVTAFVPKLAKAGAGGVDEESSGTGDDALDFVPIVWVAPQHYSRPDSSGLTATVSSKQHHFTFELKP